MRPVLSVLSATTDKVTKSVVACCATSRTLVLVLGTHIVLAYECAYIYLEMRNRSTLTKAKHIFRTNFHHFHVNCRVCRVCDTISASTRTHTHSLCRDVPHRDSNPVYLRHYTKLPYMYTIVHITWSRCMQSLTQKYTSTHNSYNYAVLAFARFRARARNNEAPSQAMRVAV